MGLMTTTSERLRRATQLWHAYLTITSRRFELAQFLKDPAFERQTLDSALASGDQKLIGLAQDWLRDTGHVVPNAAARPGIPVAAPEAGSAAETPKPAARYLRGVR